MTILAIDPGPSQTACVCWDGEKIRGAFKQPNQEAHSSILTWAKMVDQVACERVECYGMPVGKEVFDTVYFSGRVWESVSYLFKPFHLVPRREVKLHLCGQARAKDSNIRQALIDRFGPKGVKSNPGISYNLKADMWQAWALAVTCFDNPKILTP